MAIGRVIFVAWMLGLPVVVAAQETRLVEKNGRVYRETYHTQLQSVEEKVYQRSLTTEVQERQRYTYVPVTQYRWESRVHHWWNPFRTNTVSYHKVPHTRLQQQVQTVRVPVTVSEWTPVTRMARVPTRVVARDREQLRVDFEAGLAATKIVFQPIVRPDHQVFAYEVLLRVDHPRFATPVDLIHAASELERRWDLDRRVRHLVAAHIEAVPAPTHLFVNLLPESILDEALVDDADPLRPHRDRIVLEITERAPLGVIDDVDDRLDIIRRAGFRLALDDLGAGYAGLTSLVTMRPDIVKFDMELVRDIDQSPERSSLLSAMTVVSHDLGALVLGEGIESQAEMQHLAGLGCDLFQGYLLGKPGPLPDESR